MTQNKHSETPLKSSRRARLKTKARQFSYRLKYDYLTIDKIILFVAGGLCIAWICGAIDSVSRNWQLANDYNQAERELKVASLEVDNLKLENAYRQTTEYQELAARRIQNKKLAGETMVYLPANSDAAKAKDAETTKATTVTASENVSNFDQWMRFLFGI